MPESSASSSGTEVGPSQAANDRLLLFRLGRAHFALPVDFVEEVGPVLEPTPVPTAPSHVAGVANLRGKLITILDLVRLLAADDGDAQAGSGSIESLQRTLVCMRNEVRFGFVADRVLGVEAVSVAALAPVDPVVLGANPALSANLFTAQLDHDAGLVAVVDPARLCSHLIHRTSGTPQPGDAEGAIVGG